MKLEDDEASASKQGTAAVSHEEICDGALKHYEELADKCHDWYSVVPRAIRFYKKYGPEIKDKDDSLERQEERSEC